MAEVAISSPVIRQRRYSSADVEAGIDAVLANKGYVQPVAEAIGMPRRTLAEWWGRYREAARTGRTRQNTHPELAERFYALAYAAQDRAMEAVGSATAYQATLMAAISTDKGQVLSGGVTSRSEHVARYVEGNALHSMAARVIDLPALGSGLSGGDRTPKVAGQVKMGYPLRQSAGLKGKTKKRAPRGAANKVSLSRGKRAASSSPTANSAVLTATTTVLSEPFTGAVPSRGSTPEIQDVRGE